MDKQVKHFVKRSSENYMHEALSIAIEHGRCEIYDGDKVIAVISSPKDKNEITTTTLS